MKQEKISTPLMLYILKWKKKQIRNIYRMLMLSWAFFPWEKEKVKKKKNEDLIFPI